MEKGESCYGQFDTQYGGQKKLSPPFDIFHVTFSLSKWTQIFVGCVHHDCLYEKGRLMSICVCRVVR
jgi:hypothetical protein